VDFTTGLSLFPRCKFNQRVALKKWSTGDFRARVAFRLLITLKTGGQRQVRCLSEKKIGRQDHKEALVHPKPEASQNEPTANWGYEFLKFYKFYQAYFCLILPDCMPYCTWLLPGCPKAAPLELFLPVGPLSCSCPWQQITCTAWWFHPVPMSYHLVMTNIAMERSTHF